MKFNKLILASASPRRKILLKKAGYAFKVIPSDVKETHPIGLKPKELVMHLALKKARSIAKKYPSAVVLGADTLVFLRGKPIGKPKSEVHAKRILKSLSGAWQEVLTGVAIVRWDQKKVKVSYGRSKVKFRVLTDNEIDQSANKNMDKAGAYSVQEQKDAFVEKMVGDYDNVVGCPVGVVNQLLRHFR